MNILIAYHSIDWHRAGYYPEKYFKALGHEVHIIQTEKTPYWTNFYDRLPFYFPKGVPISIREIEKRAGRDFDLVLEYDSSGQYHLTGRGTKPDCKRVLWSMDTHLYAKRKFQSYFQKDFDMILTCHRDFFNQFKKTESRWLAGGFDPEVHYKIVSSPKIYDVAFSGNVDPEHYKERHDLLQGLSRKFNVGIFHKSHYAKEATKIWNQTKIAFHKSFNGDFSNRVFEVLACGTFLICDRIGNGLLDLFEDGKHLVTYSDYQELEEKVAYYLAHDEERERIANNGYEEVTKNHSYYHRAKTIVEFVEG